MYIRSCELARPSHRIRAQAINPLSATFSVSLVPGWGEKKPGVRASAGLQMAGAHTHASHNTVQLVGTSACERKQGSWQASGLRASKESKQAATKQSAEQQACNILICLLCLDLPESLTIYKIPTDVQLILLMCRQRR